MVRKGRRWGRRQKRGGGAWGWHRGRRCSGDDTDSGGRGGGVGEPREARRWHRIWTTGVGGAGGRTVVVTMLKGRGGRQSWVRRDDVERSET
jgi:hypothetical protein